MQVDLNFGVLSKSELMRLSSLLEALREPKRSKAFNGFLFWTAREAERELRGRKLKVPLVHVANVEVQRMRPGEVLFLQRQLTNWETEFGGHVMGRLVDIFWQASAAVRHAPQGAGWWN